MKVATIKQAWNAANRIFPTDYEKDSCTSERAGYDIFRSTLPGCNAWISDLGERLELNLPDGSTVNIWITGEPVDALGVPGVTFDGGKTVDITLTDGNVITVERDATHPETGTTWAYKVDGQYFGNKQFARVYLRALIAERLTGFRVIYHAPRVPGICGGSVERAARGGCLHTEQNRAICMDCAYSEQCRAHRDGVTLKYAF